MTNENEEEEEEKAATMAAANTPPPSSNNNNNNLVVVLAGPTAVGKSDVAAQLCRRIGKLEGGLGGIIVSADSVQAYRGVQIGANKPTIQERKETPHLLVDIVDCETTSTVNPDDEKEEEEEEEAKEEIKQYNAAEWQRDALYVISSLLGRQQQQQQQDTTTTTTSPPNDSLFATNIQNNADLERRKVIDETIEDAKKQLQQQQQQQQGDNTQDNNNNNNEPIIPVVVGGTMMYLQWLVHGRPDAAKPSAQVVDIAQKEIYKFQKNDDWLGAVKYVASKGPIFAKRITKLCGKDWYRLRRTFEIALTTTTTTTTIDANSNNTNATSSRLIESLFTGEREGSLDSFGYDVRCFFLCPDIRMAHTKLVDERCEMMIRKGLLKETTDLKLAGQLPEMAARAIGYRQTLQYLEREDPKDQDEDAFQEYLDQFTTATRQYSKKQMQWFRKDRTFVFVPVAIEQPKARRVENAARAIEEMIRLPREEYMNQCFGEDSIHAKTIKDNEAQGKGMKFYQMKRYILQPGTKELETSLQEADRCTQQLQAKKKKKSTDHAS